VRGVKIYRSRGKLFVYHRKTGKRLQPPDGMSTADFINSAAFLAAVEKLDVSKPRAALPGTLGALITAYRRSPEFLELAARTCSDYQKVFDYLQPIAGDPLSHISSAYVIEVRDAAFRAHKRRFANYVLAVMRLLLKWGAVRDLVDTNQAATVPKLRRPRETPKANRAWDDDECEAVLRAAKGGLKVGVALGMFAGMREGDAISVGRGAYDGNWLRWSQNKTGQPVELPVHPRLGEILEAALTSPGAVASLTLVHRERAGPYSGSGFRTMFFRLVRRLEAEGKVRPGLTFHGLRHTAGRLLADRGADPRTIAALLGHKTLQMAAHYSDEADRKKRAVAAVAKLRPARKVSNARDKDV
jgi:integrase